MDNDLSTTLERLLADGVLEWETVPGSDDRRRLVTVDWFPTAEPSRITGPATVTRPTVRLWHDVTSGTVIRHNRHHTVQVRSCRLCAAHGNAVVLHPLSND